MKTKKFENLIQLVLKREKGVGSLIEIVVRCVHVAPALQNLTQRQYCMMKTKKRKMPEISVATPKPIKSLFRSSLMLVMQDLLGLPSAMVCDHEKREGLQIPAQP